MAWINFDSEYWRKLIEDAALAQHSPPHRSNKKYIFNQASKCVFLGNRYIGQGQISETSLMVTQYNPISANKFIITHLN